MWGKPMKSGVSVEETSKETLLAEGSQADSCQYLSLWKIATAFPEAIYDRVIISIS